MDVVDDNASSTMWYKLKLIEHILGKDLQFPVDARFY
ncbi:hypothetical protein J2736_000768 [Paenibacillus qinlingensis]|uniref:Uncharacterized protein n=1 Tax=Paenibacillus qinlingensis TaxID=1837343 RepID=A0ABU1NQ34_9BACL|nr:hypothetical protein [Paenibacillus qinlingensis]